MAPPAPLFDRYVIVDWSANATPKLGRDSVWIQVADRSGAVAPPVNLATRAAARQFLTEVLTASTGERVLVGFDMPYGYPGGFARAIGLTDDPPWRATWDHLATEVVDDATNANNRFAVASACNAAIGDGPGPFWATTSVRHVTPWLARTKAPGFPHGALAEHRCAELALRARGLRPASVWQLAGAGSVGSQTLVGIPVVHALRWHPSLAERSVVWPFETGLVPDPTGGRADAIVHAEIWPTWAGPPDPARHPVRDAAQVAGLADHLRTLDDAGELAPLFAPSLDASAAHAVVAEEGWVLGATP